jgi:hypothetical protein
MEDSYMPIQSLYFIATRFTFGLAGLVASAIHANEAQSPLPQPVTIAATMAAQEFDDDGAVASTSNLPASITAQGEVLALATDGPFVFEPLSTRGTCSLRPDVRCTGPDYCGCTPRIYYGTNPSDDDPVLPLHPTINDPKTRYWYHHAFDRILKKKRIAEAIK